MTHSRAYRASAALLAVLAAAACTDRSPTDPGGRALPPGSEPHGPGGALTAIALLTCTASVESRSVACVPATPSTGGASGLIIGNQGVYVQVTSSNVNYNAGTGSFTFDATLQNLIEQPLGTTDGDNPDPTGIRIFFASGPSVTAGTGLVSVVPDGFDTFTEAAQPYYHYPYLLAQTAVSPAEGWSFVVPPTVTTFVFGVYVAAPVEYPDGYITMDGELPGASHGPLHPSTPHAVAAVVKNAYGVVQPGTVSFSTSDAACATVSAGGTVTGVRAGTCTITATSGSYAGELVFDVTGTVRTWDGSASTDWSTPANWAGDVTPAAADSVVIPTGVPNFPALVAATPIGGVEVADGATLSLGAFDLTASANVSTGPTPGSGILATTGVLELAGATGTVLGRVPSLRVTGDYALAGDLDVVAPGQVLSGRLLTGGYLFRTQ
jgi:hypothetical protein